MASSSSWRRTLPAAQLAFFLGALTLGCPYLRVVIEEFRQPPNPAEFVFRPEFIDGALSTWEQLAIGINLPHAGSHGSSLRPPPRSCHL